jgi:hypothetical protein
MFSFLRVPALQALLVQLAASGTVLLAAGALARAFAIDLNLLTASFLQALFALALARWRRAPSWWLWIHFLFAPGLVALLALQLPSWIYLCAFAALLGLYWQTFRTQVPFFPSTPAVRTAVARLLPTRPVRFVDIGSGFGGLVLELAATRRDSRFSGIELAPLPWLCSRMRARLSASPARFRRGDYARLDLGSFDVAFAYLSPAAMPALWRKAQAEMRPGSLLLSYEFDIPGVPAQLALQPVPAGPTLYGWRF